MTAAPPIAEALANLDAYAKAMRKGKHTEFHSFLNGPSIREADLRAVIEAVRALQKENAELNKIEFWWPEDGYGDTVYDNPRDVMDDADMDEVVKCPVGRSLGYRWVTRLVLTVDESGDWDDTEIVVFDNPEDAAKCWPESLKACRDALPLPDGGGE